MSNGWPLVSLEQVFAIARGGSPRPIDSFLTDDPDGVNWVLISDATESGKYINSTRKRIREDGAKRSRAVKPGDFLLTNSMSFGRPYIMNTSGCIHDGWLVLSPRDGNVSRDFFYYLLGSDLVYSEFARLAAGATVKNLNIDLVKRLQVPLPPLSEQRRIAAILDKADALRTKRRTAIAQIDTLTQSIFIDLFGESRHFDIAVLSQIADLKRGPFGGALKKEIFVPEGFKVYEQRNAIQNDFAVGRYFITEKKYREMQDFALSPQDLIVSCSGTLGRVAIVPQTAPLGVINQALLRIRVNTERVTPLYLKTALESDETQRKLTGISHGTGLQNFPPMSEIRNLGIAVPPLTLQYEFSCRTSAVETLKTGLHASLAELNSLFSGLLHRAFRGEL